ncbi:NYN domain-containing protein [Rubritalea tangerina]|uniref:NYN domain-containing protein n=1 Tax=Rubritalea tangerina TaxID=430798 RepID=A0ABW4ZEQ7_9BACT
MSESLEYSPRLAVLIDADNTPAKSVPLILEEIAKLGTASVRRAYGDWSCDSLKNWKDLSLDNSIQPMQQFAYTKGKNASDIAMIIDALDLMYTELYDGFCLVSSDSDFTPLATRIRQQSLTVYGIGQKKTPKPFVEACDKFIYSELLDKNDNSEIEVKPITDAKLFHYFKTAIDATSDDSGWSPLGPVGQHINNLAPDFDSRSWGHSKLSDLAKAIPKIETNQTAKHFRVRIKASMKKTAKKSPKQS